MTLSFPENSGEKIWSVSEISSAIKNKLELSFPFVTVRGEISNLKASYQGHIYLSLKDEGAVINAVIWQSSARKLGAFKPEDGMQVLAAGRITVYPPHGRYQLSIETLLPEGRGALEAEFFKLKERLEKEGLFDPAVKKPLPAFPRIIGVITSGEGAAVRDIIRTIVNRNPGQRIIFRPALVQGESAPADLIRALKQLNSIEGVDVIVLGRGGGSIEDLWAFNDEGLAREIFAFPIPIISGVGHESDFTICDFVADYRAATPTAAAAAATPDAELTLKEIQDARRAAGLRMAAIIKDSRRRLSAAAPSIHPIKRIIDYHRFRLIEGMGELHKRCLEMERERRARLNELSNKVLTLHPSKRLMAMERELTRLTTLLKDYFFELRFRAAKQRYAAVNERLLLSSPRPLLRLSQNALGPERKNLERAFSALYKEKKERLSALTARLEAASPASVLKRGYSITEEAETGKVVRNPSEAPAGKELNIRFYEGAISAVSSGEKKK